MVTFTKSFRLIFPHGLTSIHHVYTIHTYAKTTHEYERNFPSPTIVIQSLFKVRAFRFRIFYYYWKFSRRHSKADASCKKKKKKEGRYRTDKMLLLWCWYNFLSTQPFISNSCIDFNPVRKLNFKMDWLERTLLNSFNDLWFKWWSAICFYKTGMM